MRIFQHLDELKISDGVGNDAYGLANVFHKLKVPTHFVTRLPIQHKLNPDYLYHLTTNFSYALDDKDIHILHYGGAGFPYEFFQKLPGKKIIRFHNITPAFYYKETTTVAIFEAMQKFESLSYLELASYSAFCDAVWCDSQFNYETIQYLDFRNPYVLPICKKYETNRTTSLKSFSGNLVFVGRFAPQKKWEDLIQFFAEWRRFFPEAQLECVGTIIGAFDGYFDFLKRKVSELDLGESVHFNVGLSDEKVLAKIAESDIFLSMSEHEGFCLPLLEAFGCNTLVAAYDAGAVSETLRTAGILFKTKNWKELAFLLKSVLNQKNAYNESLKKQKEAIQFFNDYPFEDVIPRLLFEVNS